ncbi:hypothetical protein DEU56DRAFT_752539 [Suillus clintonianus]|uniref:uncharacterized protein n=1 Tax=Suillus clintonianus TaxID=1904413 RepID=UPI001B85E498|nr:uncharacterized protein DEU56DRAFT_752539 [Suillus clintonianus]KAG2150883.1 hypothetical protein DEU56DRAFT_752539 [Suillus clintonianus]
MCTVKAQFQLRTLDDDYPPDVVVCSKKAANTLMYAISKTENLRWTGSHMPSLADGREAIPFMRSSGTSSSDQLHFVVHSEHLFPDTSEQTRDLVSEFSLEDFENTDFTFTGGINEWKLKDMPDPQGHYCTAINLFNLEDIPVVVPNIQDTHGVLIHPLEYSVKIKTAVPVAVEIVLRLWTFGIDDKHPTGSRIYQTALKSMKLLPTSGAAKSLFTKATAADPKGKCKAPDAPPPEASPLKRSTRK